MKRQTGTACRACLFFVAATAVMLAGCMDSLEKQGQKTGSVLGKKTKEIKKYDPNAKQVVSDSKFHFEPDPLYAVQAIRPAFEQTQKMKIDYALKLYYAEHERYPKDLAEFKEKIMKPNQIEFPVLPEGYEYAYDVENHELKVVKPIGEKAGENGGGAAANGNGQAAK